MSPKEGGGVEPGRSAPSGSPTGTRREVGDSASSQRHPPHVTPNAEGAPIQGEHPSADPVPVKGANAQGTDNIPVRDDNPLRQQAQPIDEESMYSGRPEEDKDRKPSSPHTP